jgi:hypothetical protein
VLAGFWVRLSGDGDLKLIHKVYHNRQCRAIYPIRSFALRMTIPAAKGSHKNNVTFWTPMPPVWLPVQKLVISRYSCVFQPCQAGASTLKIMNLFFREPHSEAHHTNQPFPASSQVHRSLLLISAEGVIL